jgi:hypothetical protein
MSKYTEAQAKANPWLMEMVKQTKELFEEAWYHSSSNHTNDLFIAVN